MATDRDGIYQARGADPGDLARGMGRDGLLARLAALSSRLRMSGLLMAILTIFNLAILMVAVFISYYFFSISVGRVVAISITFTATLVALLFDRLRAHGDVIYEELVADIQRAPVFRADDSQGRVALPDIGVRLAMREFASAEDAPLVPGRFGPLAYVVLNLAIAIAQLAFVK
jgi:hypothetical protein